MESRVDGAFKKAIDSWAQESVGGRLVVIPELMVLVAALIWGGFEGLIAALLCFFIAHTVVKGVTARRIENFRIVYENQSPQMALVSLQEGRGGRVFARVSDAFSRRPIGVFQLLVAHDEVDMFDKDGFNVEFERLVKYRKIGRRGYLLLFDQGIIVCGFQ